MNAENDGLADTKIMRIDSLEAEIREKDTTISNATKQIHSLKRQIRTKIVPLLLAHAQVPGLHKEV